MKKNKRSFIEIESEKLNQELQEAVEEYNRAWDNFNNADYKYIEITLDFLKAAEIKLNATTKKCKLIYDELKEYEVF